MTRRKLVIGGAIAVATAIAALFVWFQPQKLFIDQKVSEAAPTRASNATPSTELRDLNGAFSSLAHETKGRATVLRNADGSGTLRLADFSTSNGPDVRVYLSAGDEDAYGKDFVDLGGLKGNVGDQNYAIPARTDLERYDTAVIWCRRFTVAFGAAPLA
jgi:hypothetical protein